MKEVESNQERYEVIDKSVNTLQRGTSLEIVTHIIIENFESGTRLALTATRFIPDNPYYSTDKVDPVEILVIGDEVTLKNDRIDQVISKRKNRQVHKNNGLMVSI